MPLQLSPAHDWPPAREMPTPIATAICSPVSSASSSTLILPPPPVLGCSRRLRRAFRSPHRPCPPHRPRLFSAPRSTPVLAQRPSPHPLPRLRRLPLWRCPHWHRRLLSPSWGRGKRRRKKSQAVKLTRLLASHQNPPRPHRRGDGDGVQPRRITLFVEPSPCAYAPAAPPHRNRCLPLCTLGSTSHAMPLIGKHVVRPHRVLDRQARHGSRHLQLPRFSGQRAHDHASHCSVMVAPGASCLHVSLTGECARRDLPCPGVKQN
uniref:Uncharacterized protein n=1 Tax=Zea mays TaxID=4577 RepID=B6SUK3_MAIZE|nr:hypothetical protein [Zea mays]